MPMIILIIGTFVLFIVVINYIPMQKHKADGRKQGRFCFILILFNHGFLTNRGVIVYLVHCFL